MAIWSVIGVSGDDPEDMALDYFLHCTQYFTWFAEILIEDLEDKQKPGPGGGLPQTGCPTHILETSAELWKKYQELKQKNEESKRRRPGAGEHFNELAQIRAKAVAMSCTLFQDQRQGTSAGMDCTSDWNKDQGTSTEIHGFGIEQALPPEFETGWLDEDIPSEARVAALRRFSEESGATDSRPSRKPLTSALSLAALLLGLGGILSLRSPRR